MSVLTGSVVLPLKALLLNMLSLTATFGALVWIFQQGHLGGLRHAGHRHADGKRPCAIVLPCFRALDGLRGVLGLADPRVLDGIGRKTHADNAESVALGLARTGRVVTAAAVLMAVTFASLMAAKSVESCACAVPECRWRS